MYKKKILLIVLIIIAMLSIRTSISKATDGVITGITVKLREGPSLDADLVTLLSVDNNVEVLGKEGDWYHIKFEKYEGYVYADYIDVEGEVSETPTNEVTNNVVENTTSNTVVENNIVSNEINSQTNEISNNVVTSNTVTDTTNSYSELVGTNQILLEDTGLKILPLINSENIQVLSKDSTVTVNDEVNGWAYVSNNVVSGWLRSDKLTPAVKDTSTDQPEENKEQPEEDTEATESNESTIGYISAGSVNVRESASTSSEVLTTLTRNTKVTVESIENGWAKISTTSGVSGYVSNQYISSEQVTETNRGDVERTSRENEVASDEVEETNIEVDTEQEKSNTAETNTSISNKGEEVANYAKTLLGKSYVYGGVGPNSFDCSGFTQYVYGKFGVNLSHSASAQSNVGYAISKSNLQLGDMVFFTQGGSSIGHVGIYVGNNSFIHAANPQKGVVITSLSDGYYTRNYKTARRVF